MARFVFFPAFDDPAAIIRNVLTSIWYLAPLADRGLEVVVPVRCAVPSFDAVPEEFDPQLATLWKAHGGSVRFVAVEGDPDPTKLLAPGTSVLMWSMPHQPAAVAFVAQSGIKPAPRIMRVDQDGEKNATSFYLKTTSNDGMGSAEALTLSRARFADWQRRLAGLSRFYVCGTGPSLDQVEGHDFSDGVRIATNSMVANHAFLARFQPSLVVASDPIFHAGSSSYAAEFRRNLTTVLDNHDCFFMFPMRDWGIYATHLPERHRRRLIGVPIVGQTSDPANTLLNTRLPGSFWVGSTGNVMTLFLLPLAASLGKEIVLAGFDGRPLSEDSYYWGHSAANQIGDKMADIQKAHPGFFKIDFNDYVLEHSRVLDTYFRTIRAEGLHAVSLTDSHFPAVRAVYRPGLIGRLPAALDGPAVSVIVPAFNAGNYVETTLRTLLGQSFGDFEVVVVDDGSTDDTAEVVARWAAIDDRIRLFRQQPGGVSRARNTGLGHARGKYICFLDADDTLPPHSLRARVAALDKRAGSNAIVYGRYEVMDERGRPLNLVMGGKEVFRLRDLYYMPLHICSLMGPAWLLKSMRFREGLANGEDWLYVSELARTGTTLEPVDAVVYQYRWHAGSVTRKDYRAHVEKLMEILDEVAGPPTPSYSSLPALDRPAADRVRTEKAKRLHMLVAHMMLADAGKEIAPVLSAIGEDTAEALNLTFPTQGFWTTAVRQFTKPNRSKDLAREIMRRKGSIEAGLRVLAKQPAFSRLHGAFMDFLAEVGEAGEQAEFYKAIATAIPPPPRPAAPVPAAPAAAAVAAKPAGKAATALAKAPPPTPAAPSAAELEAKCLAKLRRSGLMVTHAAPFDTTQDADGGA